jgi:hypothetical protein
MKNRIVNMMTDNGEGEAGNTEAVKRISLVDLVSGKKTHATIEPGTAPRDVVKTLGLNPGRTKLMKGKGGDVFGDDENLFTALPDGGVVYYGTPAYAGGEELPVDIGALPPGFWPQVSAEDSLKSFQELVARITTKSGTHATPWEHGQDEHGEHPEFDFPWEQPVRVIARPSDTVHVLSRLTRTQPSAIKVERAEVPYWQERGFTKNGIRYEGYARVPGVGAWKVHMEESPSGHVEICILFPDGKPEALQQHPKSPCFSKRGLSGNWFRVNIIGGCKSASAGLAEVELVLNESFSRYA